MERWNDRENREFLRAGTIAASALNPYRKQHADYITAFDIFPHLPQPRPALPTPEEAAQNMRSFFKGLDRAKTRKPRPARKPVTRKRTQA